jgi:hypothetical protein
MSDEHFGDPWLWLESDRDAAAIIVAQEVDRLRGLVSVQCSYVERDLGQIIRAYFRPAHESEFGTWMLDQLTASRKLDLARDVLRRLELLDEEARTWYSEAKAILTERNRLTHGTVTGGPDPDVYEAWQESIQGSTLRESVERARGGHATELRRQLAASYRATIRHRSPREAGGDVITVDEVRSLIARAVELSHQTLIYAAIVSMRSVPRT